jgi:site-specific DNA-methyltransferase (cytosine-N4-specific)
VGSRSTETTRSAAQAYLKRIATDIRGELTKADRTSPAVVERDIQITRLLANAGLIWAKNRERIQKALKVLGIDENSWCKRELGVALNTLRGYRQVARCWKAYEQKRRELGDVGVTGMDFAKSLVPRNRPQTNSRKPGDDSGCERLDMSRCTFITDDALPAIKKMQDESVDVVPASPPYFPLKRTFGGPFDGRAVGWEQTPTEYIDHLVKIYREVRRVLKPSGTVVVVMGDSYSTRGMKFRPNGYKADKLDRVKQRMPVGFPIQAGDRPPGDLLLLPWRFAIAMQNDGWILRMSLIWDKGKTTPDPVKDRTTLTYDVILIFVKQRSYFWDRDAIREPSIYPTTLNALWRVHSQSEIRRDIRMPPHPLGRNAGSVLRFKRKGATKAGIIRRDFDRDSLVIPASPLGHNAGSVLRINKGNYRGAHTAPVPPKLAHWILKATCDDEATVLCPFGGSGTFPMVALQLGHKAIYIDINEAYTQEAQERMRKAPANFEDDDSMPLVAANDN